MLDEIAVEAATRLKEAGVASEIIAVSIGPAPNVRPKALDFVRPAVAAAVLQARTAGKKPPIA
jgi:electron transfer flavoprotein alpha/beta subunit